MPRPFTVLLASCLILLPGLAVADGDAPPTRLGHSVVPTFQAVELHIDANRPDYSGQVRIELDVLESTDRFRLHSEGSVLGPLTLTVRGKTIPIVARELASGMWELRSETRLPRGACTLEIPFTNEFDTRGSGLYRLESDGHAYTFSQFEATDAREAFPCFDEPEFKIRWQFTLIVPAEHVAITNMPVLRETPADGGAKRVLYKRTPPMPSYLLAVCTGPFETVAVPGMKIPTRVVAPRGQIGLAGHARRVTAPLMTALERYFGRPYPYEKLDLIAVPEYWYGAMENPGAITFVDNGLLLPEAAGVAQQRRLVSTVAHELAHMWFGDLVTMKWWDDLWLNESFATWIGNKISDQVYPELEVQLDEMGEIDRAKRTDARSSTRVIRQHVEAADNLSQLADALAYNKGHAVLRTFEQWLTPAVFQKGVRLYLKRNEWKNAEAADLWSALSSASGRDVGAAMGTFLDQAGIPLVRVEPHADGRVTITQQRFAHAGVEADSTEWQIPMTLRYSDGAKVRTMSLLLDTHSTTVALPGAERIAWIHPNADEVGYYRWTLPAAELDALSREAADALTLFERTGFLSNLSALLDAGVIDGGAYLAALPLLSGDSEPAVINAVLDGLQSARASFWTPEIDASFARYVKATLQAPVERFGFDTRPDEDENVRLLRPDLLEWMADGGHDIVAIAHGEALADAFLEDPASIDPSMIQAALRVAALRGDRARFDQLREHFETTHVPTERSALLSALGSFGDVALVREALTYSLSGPLRAQEIRRLMSRVSQVPDREALLYEWISTRYEDITARIPDIQQANLALLMGGCTRAQIDALEQFFEAPEHRPSGIDDVLRRVVATNSDCVSLREREGAAVKTYLDRLMAAP